MTEALMLEFYDLKPLELSDEWLDIERMYCFDWDKFDRVLLDRLNTIFAMLPNSIKCDAHGCPWWYSDSEDIENGYLTASIEPPGLQVFGTLKPQVWQHWEREFHCRVSDLPFRKLH